MSTEIYDKLSRPPEEALKTIAGGRLKGMTDISPQWRIKAMTEAFGMCGIGWKVDIDELWTIDGDNGQVFAFAKVLVYVLQDDTWSHSIPGVGGSMLITKESSGLRCNDEAYKMAVTDAMSVALKHLGVAADIYAKKWDGAKYIDEGKKEEPQAFKPEDGISQETTEEPQKNKPETATPDQVKLISTLKTKLKIDDKAFHGRLFELFNVNHRTDLTKEQAHIVIDALKEKEAKQKDSPLVEAAKSRGAKEITEDY